MLARIEALLRRGSIHDSERATRRAPTLDVRTEHRLERGPQPVCVRECGHRGALQALPLRLQPAVELALPGEEVDRPATRDGEGVDQRDRERLLHEQERIGHEVQSYGPPGMPRAGWARAHPARGSQAATRHSSAASRDG